MNVKMYKKTALDSLPSIFEQAMKKDPEQTTQHLEEIVDGLFDVLDNHKYEPNHDSAKKALDDIISQVVEQGDPEGVLYLSGLLAEKTDISKVNDPNARNLARENLQKILFGNHNDDVQEQIKNLKPNNDNKNLNESNPLNNKDQSNILPDKNSPYEEWLNMANETQNGPSDKLMNQGLNDQDSFGQKGNKGIKQENTGYDNNKKPLYKGNGNNELNEKNNNNSPNNNNNNKKK